MAPQIWGISVLGSGSKAAFKAKFGLPFTLIADEQHAVAERYGVWVDKVNYGRTFKGIQRATFLIDPDGHDRQGVAKGQARWPRCRGPRGDQRAVAARHEHRLSREPDKAMRHRSWGEPSDASGRR